jgi:4-hydroxy-tetrahydrodipicolinate synthase
VVPRVFARICRYLEAGDSAQALALDARLEELNVFLGVEPNPIPVKAILQRLGIGAGLRLPLVPLSETHSGLADRMSALSRELESQLQ